MLGNKRRVAWSILGRNPGEGRDDNIRRLNSACIYTKRGQDKKDRKGPCSVQNDGSTHLLRAPHILRSTQGRKDKYRWCNKLRLCRDSFSAPHLKRGGMQLVEEPQNGIGNHG